MEVKKQKVIAVALIRNAERKILLQKRIDPLIPEADGKWEFPGGVVEFGETPSQAAEREVKEETGCNIEIVRLLPFAHSRVWQRTDGEVIQTFVWCFEARYVGGELKSLDKKVSEVQWYRKEEIAALDALPGTEEFLELID